MTVQKIKQIFTEPDAYLNQQLTIAGWVRTSRTSKTFGFIEVNDGSFFRNLQVVVDHELENFDSIAKLGISAAIRVQGTLVESPGAKQPFELKADQITVEAEAADDYPLQKKRHSFEFLRTIAHLRPRTNSFAAVFRLRSLAAYAVHRFFQEQGFVYVHTPIITGSDCEGAGEMFSVSTFDLDRIPRDDQGQVDYGRDFFGKQTHLTVSGQLEAEAYSLAFGNVYTFGPTFRAENSNTARHAAEFWMIEPEMAFAELTDNMDMAEAMLKYIIRYCLEQAPDEMEFFDRFVDKGLLRRLDKVLQAEFARITYTEAVELLQKESVDFEYPVVWGRDLQTEHERHLTEKLLDRPVFVRDYPKQIKSFYMRLNDDDRTVAAMDLLVPAVGEIIGGSQREERLHLLAQRMQEMGLDEEEYWWYQDLRKYGGAKHSGYGLGFERLLMYLTGMANIRDVISFPRTVKNAEF